MTKKRPGPAPGVRLMEVSVLQKCPLRESWLYYMIHSRLLCTWNEQLRVDHRVQGWIWTERVNNLIILASTTTAVKPTLALGVYSRVEAMQSSIKTYFVFIGVKMGTRLVNWFNWWEHVARSAHNILTILFNWAVLSRRKWYFLFWRNFKKTVCFVLFCFFQGFFQRSVCYTKYGCFKNTANPWRLPQSPSKINTAFYLFTRQNREIPQTIDDENKNKLAASNYNILRHETIFVVHGFKGKFFFLELL